MPNFVKIVQTAAEIWQFFDFSKMATVRHLGFVGTTREGHLVIVFAVQYLIGIDAVVIIICTFFDFRVWLENAYSRPKIGEFWGF